MVAIVVSKVFVVRGGAPVSIPFSGRARLRRLDGGILGRGGPLDPLDLDDPAVLHPMNLTPTDRTVLSPRPTGRSQRALKSPERGGLSMEGSVKGIPGFPCFPRRTNCAEARGRSPDTAEQAG